MENKKDKTETKRDLKDMLYTSNEHNPKETLNFGTLGIILMNYNKIHKSNSTQILNSIS